MGFYSHVEEFEGRRVVEFRADKPIDPEQAVRIGLTYGDGDTVVDRLAQLLSDPAADQVKSLVIGPWFTEDPYDGDANGVVEALAAAGGQLTSLTSLFFGDIISEECEVSWIQQGDLSPLWSGFPRLEVLRIRGGEGLRLGNVQHDSLKSLEIECGGLPGEVVGELAAASLPALESLELYLGDDDYGWSGTADDVRKLVSAEFPKLSHLGLVNSAIQDDVTVAILESPLMAQLQTLDLSLGTISDVGGKALLASNAVRNLKSLRIEHHFMTKEVVEQLQGLPIEVTIADGEDPEDDWRYVAVGE